MKMKTKYYKTWLDQVFDITNFIFMSIILVITIYPLYYILIYSISSPQEASKGLIFLPKMITLTNYQTILNTSNVLNAFVISLSRAVFGCVLTVIGCCLTAFLLTNKDLPFRKIIYRLLVISMYISAGIIPWYMTMSSYGLKNNYLLYILPSIINAFYVILIKTYIEQSISPSLIEAAEIDGAETGTIFFRIIIPLSKPILATVGLFSAVAQWNSWTDNLFLVSNVKLMTLQLMLYNYLNSVVPSAHATTQEIASQSIIKTSPSSIRMTMAMITIIPIFLVYPFVQKYFQKGIMIGAVKG
jgi:putative aldouronate transport system permease protein